MPEEIKVEPDQLWVDNDVRYRRGPLRFIHISEVGATHALGMAWWSNAGSGSARGTKIALRRFKPNSTGYRLATDAERKAQLG